MIDFLKIMRILSKIALSLCLGFFSLKAGKYKDMQKLRKQWYDFGSIVFGEDFKTPTNPEDIVEKLQDYEPYDDEPGSTEINEPIKKKMMFKVLLRALGLFMAYPEKIKSWTLDVEEMDYYRDTKLSHGISSKDMRNFAKFLNKSNNLEDYHRAKSFLHFGDLLSLRYCEEIYLKEKDSEDCLMLISNINFNTKELDKYFKISEYINIKKLIKNKDIIKKYIENNRFHEQVENFFLFQNILNICTAHKDHIDEEIHVLIEKLNSFFYILSRKFSVERIQLSFNSLSSNFFDIFSKKIYDLEIYNNSHKHIENLKNYKIYNSCMPIFYGVDKNNKLEFCSPKDQNDIFENFLTLVDMEKSLGALTYEKETWPAFDVLSFSLMKHQYYSSLNDVLFRNNFYYYLFDPFHQGLKFSMLAKNFSKQKNYYVSKIFGTHFIFQIIPYILGNDVIDFYAHGDGNIKEYIYNLYQWTTFYSDNFSLFPKTLWDHYNYDKRLIFFQDDNHLINKKMIKILIKEMNDEMTEVDNTKNFIKQLKFCLYISRHDSLIHKRLFSQHIYYKNLEEQYSETNDDSYISTILFSINELSTVFNNKLSIAFNNQK